MLVDLCAGCNLTFCYKVKTGISKLGKKATILLTCSQVAFWIMQKKKTLRSVTLLIFCYETYVHCNLYINYMTVMFCQNSKKKKEIAISKLMLIEWNCYGVSWNFNIFLNWNLNDILAMPGKKIRKEKKINMKALTVLSFQLRRL